MPLLDSRHRILPKNNDEERKAKHYKVRISHGSRCRPRAVCDLEWAERRRQQNDEGDSQDPPGARHFDQTTTWSRRDEASATYLNQRIARKSQIFIVILPLGSRSSGRALVEATVHRPSPRFMINSFPLWRVTH